MFDRLDNRLALVGIGIGAKILDGGDLKEIQSDLSTVVEAVKVLKLHFHIVAGLNQMKNETELEGHIEDAINRLLNGEPLWEDDDE